VGIVITDENVQDYMGFVYSIARPIANRLPFDSLIELEDLVSSGFIGLLSAAKTYREGVGASFMTYARRRIRGAMMDSLRDIDVLNRYQRKRNIGFKVGSMSATTVDSPGRGAFQLVDKDAVAPDEAVDADLFWELAVRGLTFSERRVLLLYYRYAQLGREIAERPDVQLSEARVSQIRRQLHIKLVKRFREAGYAEA
jgi:RNA polymerase sigma factor (sigma-70 family)